MNFMDGLQTSGGDGSGGMVVVWWDDVAMRW